MAVLPHLSQIVRRQQPGEQVEKRQHANDARHLTQFMDHPITQHRDNHNDQAEQDHPGGIINVQQFCHRLPSQHRVAGGEADIHNTHQHQRDDRAKHAELNTAYDHLRQTETRPLHGMQRHHRRTDNLPDQQTNRPTDQQWTRQHRRPARRRAHR